MGPETHTMLIHDMPGCHDAYNFYVAPSTLQRIKRHGGLGSLAFNDFIFGYSKFGPIDADEPQ